MAYFFVFRNGRLILEKTGDGFRIPASECLLPERGKCAYMHDGGEIDGHRCLGYYTDAEQLATGLTEKGLRESYDLLPEAFYRMAGKVWQMVYWDMNSRFCPVCGAATERTDRICKKCPSCGKEIYPPISPSIMVRISKGDSILMTHARNFCGSYKGLVAGFVEPGETLEECVEREVMEETGLKIKNLKYFGSQSWPYPSGMVVAFTADYDSGELKMQEEELDSLGFFSWDNMPPVPKKLSMARMMIDDWLERKD